MSEPEVSYEVGNRLSNGKWPVVRVTREVVAEHDDIFDAGDDGRRRMKDALAREFGEGT